MRRHSSPARSGSRCAPPASVSPTCCSSPASTRTGRGIPFIPGTEIGGVVSEISPDVRTTLKVGDRVCAGLPSGGFAEQAIVDAANVFRIPDALSFEGSTLFPTIYATAYAGLKWRANLQAGETLLVHGAAGASGLAAVEIGRAMGATVIATAGGDRKIAAVLDYGADHAIDYRKGSFRERVLELTGGRGADVVFDPVGGDVFDEFAAMRSTARSPAADRLRIRPHSRNPRQHPAWSRTSPSSVSTGASTWRGARAGPSCFGCPRNEKLTSQPATK